MVLVVSASAEFQCNGCHGTSNPVDYRPVDDSSRNISNGGFIGNHRTHLDSSASSAGCGVCHPGSSSYSVSHRENMIKISSRINSSPLTTLYKNTTTAWPQTPTPELGTCTNVNCHFEATSPVWGAIQLAYSSPANNDCNRCHGRAPSDGNHPSTSGRGKKHGDYYGTTTDSCVKCHPDHTGESNRFSHATSAGNRGLIVSFAAAPNDGSGSYSGNTNYPDYLPSRNPARNGTCSSTYCHSPGTKSTGYDPPAKTATWGASLDCTGCHNSDYASGSDMRTGSHRRHTGGISSPIYVNAMNCVKCHAATVRSDMTITDVSHHANKLVEVAFSSSSTAVNGRYNGVLATPASPAAKAPGSAYGSCTNVYCHSTGQGANGSWPPTYRTPVWGDPATGACGTCHGEQYPHAFTIGNPLTSGSHAKHLEYKYYESNALYRDYDKCVVCHSYEKIQFYPEESCHNFMCHDKGKLKHANNEVNVGFPSYFGDAAIYNGSPAPGDGYSNCANTYCHSSGTAVATGTVQNNATANWGSGTLACNACHGYPPAYDNGAPKKNSHVKHSAYTCDKCHNITTYDGNTISSRSTHVNKRYNVDAGGGVSFTYTYAPTGGTCSSSNCHGNGQGGAPAVSSFTWGSSLGCTGCHGDAASNSLSGKHQAHLNNAAVIGVNLGCRDCHAITVSDNSTVSNKAKHANYYKDYSGINAGRYSVSTKLCSNLYCHSNGKGVYVNPPAWNSSHTLGCNGCHGTGNAAGSPDYDSGPAGSATANSHSKHAGPIAYGFKCQVCHYETTSNSTSIRGDINPSKHIDRSSQNVAFDSSQGDASYVTGTRSCSGTYCHSKGTSSSPPYPAPVQTALQWGGAPLGCAGCHYTNYDSGGWQIGNYLAGSHPYHVDATSGARVACYKCHIATVSSGMTITSTSNHVNRNVDIAFDSTTTAALNAKYKGYSAIRSRPSVSAPGSFGSCDNVYCHSNGQNNGGFGITYSNPVWGVSSTGRCPSCHNWGGHGSNPGPPISSGSHTKHIDKIGGLHKSCAVCHFGQYRSLSDTEDHCIGCHKNGVNIWPILHVNGKVDVYFVPEIGGAYNGTPVPGDGYSNCSNTYCHSDGTSISSGIIPDNTSVNWGSGTLACNACHGKSNPKGSPDYANGTRKSNSHSMHTAIGCNYCHAATTYDGINANGWAHINRVYNVIPGGGISFTYTYAPTGGTCSSTYCHSPGTKSTGYDPPAKTATWGASLDCTGCHNSDYASGSDMRTGSHRRHTGGISSPIYVNAMNCVKCHAATVRSDMTITDVSHHANKLVEVAFSSSSTAVNGRYNGVLATPASPAAKAPGSAYGSCTNVYCHSTGQGANGSWPPTYRTPVWGDPATGACGTCHGEQYPHAFTIGNPLTSGSHAKHLEYKYYESNALYRDYDKCVVCHSYEKIQFYPEESCHNFMCHDKGKLKHANNEVNVGFPSYFGDAAIYNGSPAPGDGYSNCANTYCHSSGTAVATGTVQNNATANWGSGTLACNACHGYPPAYDNGAPKKNSHVKHSAYTCDKCHNITTYDGNTISSRSTHVNKRYNVDAGGGVSFTYTYAPTGGTCSAISTSCHNDGGPATWGSSP